MDLALNLTLVGITVVFSALVILALMISLYSKIITGFSSKEKAKKQADVKTPAVTEAAATTDTIADEELIAVITAAISAALQNTPTCNLRVKSFKRINQTAPAWYSAGISEYITNKL